MTEWHFRTLNQSTLVFKISAGIVTTGVLLLLNLLLVWSFGRGMSEHVSILYWQQLIGQSYWLQCLSLLLVPVTTVIWVEMGLRRLRDWRVNVAIVSVVVLFCMCAFINYLGVFGFSWLEHVGTVQFRDNAYQLATVIEYDNYTDYYPGECDRTGYRCVFHKIYRTSALGIYEAEIQLGNNAQYLIVKIDGDIVYTNDGTQEYCSPGQGGWCADDSR